METDHRANTGSVGEDAALARYRSSGYRVIARNWRCRIGELDLVLARGPTLVFCEVKTRRGAGYGGGWEAVTARKREKVRAVAQVFLIANGLRPGEVRFDVASVSIRGKSCSVEIFEDAF